MATSASLEELLLKQVQQHLINEKIPYDMESLQRVVHRTLYDPAMSTIERQLAGNYSPMDAMDRLLEHRVQTAIERAYMAASALTGGEQNTPSFATKVVRQIGYTPKTGAATPPPVDHEGTLDATDTAHTKKLGDTVKQESTGDGGTAIDTIKSLPAGVRFVLADQEAYQSLKNILNEDADEHPTLSFPAEGEAGASSDQDSHTATELADTELENTKKAKKDNNLFVVPLDKADSISATLTKIMRGSRAAQSGALKLKKNMIGEQLGKYKLLNKIGVGGYGSVFEAEDPLLGNRVAIKVLNEKAAQTPEQLQAFLDEAKRVTELDHPNIVDWKNYEQTEDGTPYFVMELLQGQELEGLLKQNESLSEERTCNILLQILDALRSAHIAENRESILHLDLKPKNVFISPPKTVGGKDRVKVIDFGIGQYVGGEVVASEEFAHADSQAGQTLPTAVIRTTPTAKDSSAQKSGMSGISHSSRSASIKRSSACTPEYASPEQCGHLLPNCEIVELDGRSDLYSLGVMAYRMVTGEYPFERPRNRMQWLSIHREQHAKSLAKGSAKVSAQFAQFVDRCLKQDRDQRYGSTEEAYQALYEIMHPPAWKTAVKWSLAACLLISVAFGIYIASLPSAQAELSLFAQTSFKQDKAKTLDQNPLYFGPSRPQVKIHLADADQSKVKSSRAKLISVEGANELGFSISQSGSSTLFIERLPQLKSTSSSQQVFVEFDSETKLRSKTFEIHYLADCDFQQKAPSLSGGPQEAYPLKDMTDQEGIDPLGLKLEIQVPIDQSQEIQELSFRNGKGDLAYLQSDRLVGETTKSYSLDLSSMSWEKGLQECTISYSDKAGNTKQRNYLLNIETKATRLLEDAAIIGGQEYEDRKYQIQAGQDLQLSVHSSNEAKLIAKLVHDSQKEALWQSEWQVNSGLNAFPINFSLNKSWEKLKLEISLLDSKNIYRANSDRAQFNQRLDLTYQASPSTYSLSWLKSDNADSIASNPKKRYYLNQPQLSFKIEHNHKYSIACKAILTGPVNKKAEEKSNQWILGTDSSLGMTFKTPSEGRYELAVQVFQLDTSTQKPFPNAIWQENYAIEMRKSAPPLRLLQLSKASFKSPGQWQNEKLKLVLDSRKQNTPVQVSYLLEDGPSGASGFKGSFTVKAGEGAVHKIGDLLKQANALQDGKYKLCVFGSDFAGNDLPKQFLEWELACQGPAIRIQEPQAALWHPQAGSLKLLLQLEDANGVKKLTAKITSVSAGIEREVDCAYQKAASSGELPASSLPTSGQWLGEFGSLGREWSEQEVKLSLIAVDRFDQVSTLSKTLKLAAIEGQVPNMISSSRSGIALSNMALIQSNEQAYLFNGRNDDSERRAFDRENLGYEYKSTAWGLVFAEKSIQSFYMDTHEVSRAEFLAFVLAEDGYQFAGNWASNEIAASHLARKEELLDFGDGGQPDWPVSNVDWDEAFAFCQWAGKELPSWVQLEYATRGDAEYRLYACQPAAQLIRPTTKELDKLICFGQTEQSNPKLWDRMRASDSNPEGVFNLSGNLSEWTRSPRRFPNLKSASLRQHYAAAKEAGALLGGDPVLTAKKYFSFGGNYSSQRMDYATARHHGRSSRENYRGFRCMQSEAKVHQIMNNRLTSKTKYAAIKLPKN